MSKSVLKDKSFAFAVLLLKEVYLMREQKKEFEMTRQLIKSWTAIWALLREAEFAQSLPDFISKLSIACKEANETQYRLELLHTIGYFNSVQYESLINWCNQLIKMLVSSIKSNKLKLK